MLVINQWARRNVRMPALLLIMKILIKVRFMVAIWKSKMAAIEPVQKKWNQVNFVPWVIRTKTKLWLKNVAQIWHNSLYFMNKVKNILPTSALKILYYALVHCHIIYGIMVWGGAQTMNKIFILQKRAIRTICKRKYRDHTEPLFKKENILKINDVFKLHVNLFMYDYRQDHLPDLPESFNHFFPNNLQRNPENSRRPWYILLRTTTN